MPKKYRTFVDEPKRITVKVNPDLHQEAKKQAERENSTISKVVRRLLIEWIAERKQRLNN